MAKPLSRPHELGRAIGYNVDPSLLLEELKRAPIGQWGDLGSNHAVLDYVQSAAGVAKRINQASPKRMWLVVKLENNVPVMIDAYTDKRAANRREKFLLQHHRPEIDAVKVVSIEVRK